MNIEEASVYMGGHYFLYMTSDPNIYNFLQTC